MKNSIIKTPGYEYLDNLGMSNFDHSIDEGLEKALQKGKCYAQYAGWNFCGEVYWGKKEQIYICEVSRYNIWVDTIQADTLEEIMEKVSEKYGDE